MGKFKEILCIIVFGLLILGAGWGIIALVELVLPTPLGV